MTRAEDRLDALAKSAAPTVMGQTQRFIGPQEAQLGIGREVYAENRATTGNYIEALSRFLWHPNAKALDVTIEEQVGISRRTKHTSFRVERAAARALYELLREQFGDQ